MVVVVAVVRAVVVVVVAGVCSCIGGCDSKGIRPVFSTLQCSVVSYYVVHLVYFYIVQCNIVCNRIAKSSALRSQAFHFVTYVQSDTYGIMTAWLSRCSGFVFSRKSLHGPTC